MSSCAPKGSGRGRVILIMGVSGAGKTTVGKKVAEALGYRFYDGDDFHAAGNKEKMRRGLALDDEDRRPWLQELSGLVGDLIREGRRAVLACSALKQQYRDILIPPNREENVLLVYLKAGSEQIRRRLANRHHAYMPARLLASQFQILEEPDNALEVDATRPVQEVVDGILRSLPRALSEPSSEVSSGKKGVRRSRSTPRAAPGGNRRIRDPDHRQELGVGLTLQGIPSGLGSTTKRPVGGRSVTTRHSTGGPNRFNAEAADRH